MLPVTSIVFRNFKSPLCRLCRVALQRCYFSQELHNKYTDTEKDKILEVINETDPETLAGYEITKGRLKKFSQWKSSNGKLKSLSDLELIDGFSDKSASKLFDSILQGPPKPKAKAYKIKGQVLHPNLIEAVRQSCKTVASIFVSVNSVSWTVIDRNNYEVLNWQYYSIDYPEGRFQITDIFDISWKISKRLPEADIYVMKAEATTLRAAGSDPNNPKVIAVNLQKAQMIAMIIALLNARGLDDMSSVADEESSQNDKIKQKVYFLRPTLPFRLYGTLVGNEKVSTDQAVEMLLQNSITKSPTNSNVYVPEHLQNMFRNQNDLQKDMLGHCLLLGLTFMDICIYKNQESINKLSRYER